MSRKKLGKSSGDAHESGRSRKLARPTRAELGRVAKRLLIGPISLLSFGAHASQWCEGSEITISGLSKHFYETKYSTKHGWNDLNVGAGFTCHLSGIGRWNDEVEAGVFRNSYRNTSVYAAYGIYYPTTAQLSVGLRNIIASGYRSHEHQGDLRFGPVPTVKIKLNDSLTLNLSVVPLPNPFICANLGIRF